MTGPEHEGMAARRRWRRLRRHALVLGVLVGLAAAPGVGHTLRQSGPVVSADSATTDAGPSLPAPSSARAARERAGTAEAAPRSDRPTSRPPASEPSVDLPVFTHRSAELEDVARRPTRLRVPALGVDAPVHAVGRAADGQLAVPADPSTVVWYREGSVPGAAGSAVLAAHVDYGGQPGAFFDLDDLRAGDEVRVDLDDGTVLVFDVVRGQMFTKRRLPVDRLFTRNGDAVLTLITCGGRFDPAARSYESNTVVQARLR